MPITAPYINARIALLRLSGFQQLLNSYATVENNLKVLDLSATQSSSIIAGYKQRLLTYFNNAVQQAVNESVIYALAGASESDNKNSLLTPTIVGIPVNPAGPANAIEQAAMLADGALAAAQLTDLISKVTTLLS